MLCWLYVCTLPQCTSDNINFMNAHINHYAIPITELQHGSKYTHIQRLYLIHNALSMRKTKTCKHIIFSDATDVLPQNVSSEHVISQFNTIINNRYSFIAGTEAACWIGHPCTSNEVQALVNRRPDMFLTTCKSTFYLSEQPCFLNTMWMATYNAALEYTAYAIQYLKDNPGNKLDDQGILNNFMIITNTTIPDYHEQLFGSLKRQYTYNVKRNLPCIVDQTRKRFFYTEGYFCSKQSHTEYNCAHGTCKYNPTASIPAILWHGNGRVSKGLFHYLKQYYV